MPPVEPSPYDFGAVSALIDEAIAANDLPGAVVQIGHGGKIVFRKAYGQRKLDGEPGLNAVPAPAEPMTEDTIFDIASLTKVLATAPAIMQLSEQGRLQVDDPVQRYLPDFNPANDPLRAEVTLRMLLTHTSGLPGDVETQGPVGPAADRQGGGLSSCADDAVGVAAGRGCPVLRHQLHPAGPVGREADGRAEDDYVQRNIFGPLGLAETRYLPAAKACGPHSMQRVGDRVGTALGGWRNRVRGGHMEHRACCRGSRRRLGTRRAEASRARTPISITCCGAR